MNFQQAIVKNVPGWAGAVLAHVMVRYDGNLDQHRRMYGYMSDDPWTIAKQIEAMLAVGIAGVIVTWQGTTSQFQWNATREWCHQTGAAGLKFALLLDPWVTPPDKGNAQEAKVIADLQTVNKFFDMPHYLINGASPIVLDFGVRANIDLIQKALPQFAFYRRHKEYSWIEAGKGWGAALATLKVDNASPTMRIPGVCLKFKDGGFWNGKTLDWNLSKWYGADGVPVRILESDGGSFWQKQLALIPKAAPWVAIVTWNDYEEETEIEPPIVAGCGISL